MSPLFSDSGGALSAEEIGVMAPVLAVQVKRFFPCDRVDFFYLGEVGADDLDDDTEAAVARVERKRTPLFDKLASRLFLPLWHDEEMIAVAAISGGDAFLASRGDEIRLLAVTRQMSESLHELVGDLRDNQTSLLNAAFFRRYLKAMAPESAFTIGMVELVSGSHRDLLQILAQLKRSGATLENYFPNRTPLCHLGSGVFGFFLPFMTDEKARKSARFMVNWLRREGMVRARLGLVCAMAGEAPRKLHDTVWETMKKARVRGSFAWAVAGRKSAAALFAVDAAVMKRLRPKWRASREFLLLLFRVDTRLSAAKEDLVSLLEPLCPVDSYLVAVDRQEVYVFIAAAAPESTAAREMAAAIQDRLFAVENVSVSVGVASYPCLDYRRGAVPVNCRKSLLHAAFFAPRGLAVFDGVSLNISGDRYYAEGDLRSAVREYRLGLKLTPESVKLLNSLGVTLAEMGRRAGAREMFTRAAAMAPRNFMAGYNLALLEVSGGNITAAIAGLRNCLEIEPENSEALLQLTALLIGRDAFPETVQLLAGGKHPLFTRRNGSGRPEVRENLVRGVLYRYLAQAYKGLGRWREAIGAVERAVSCNPGSGRAAALMGEIYLFAGEGLGPALAMCRKAVAIDPASIEAWTALGRVLMATGEYEDAEKSLRQARRLDVTDHEACALLAEVLLKRERFKDAEAMRLRAVRLAPVGH